MEAELLKSIQEALVDGNRDKTCALVEEALAAGMDPLQIVNEGCQPAMDEVGQMFQDGDAFLPELLITGRAMKAAIEVMKPHMSSGASKELNRGRVVLGTVKGDIHDIGKSLVGTLISVRGFEVKDLGVDVAPKTILDEAVAFGAKIIGTSSLLTTSVYFQEEVIKLARDKGIRDKFYMIVGGASVSPQYAGEIGADGWAQTAVGAAELCIQLVESNMPPPLKEPIFVYK